VRAVTDIAEFSSRWKVSHKNYNTIEQAYGATPAEDPALYRRHSVIGNAGKLTMPVYFTHGEKDGVIPVAHARRLAAKMKGKADFVYREIPGGDHDSALWETGALDFAMSRVAGPGHAGGSMGMPTPPQLATP
jgi:pimeloyl-ACP methyl ester carboxylesterase